MIVKTNEKWSGIGIDRNENIMQINVSNEGELWPWSIAHWLPPIFAWNLHIFSCSRQQRKNANEAAPGFPGPRDSRGGSGGTHLHARFACKWGRRDFRRPPGIPTGRRRVRRAAESRPSSSSAHRRTRRRWRTRRPTTPPSLPFKRKSSHWAKENHQYRRNNEIDPTL